ncbi:enolase C-terminal domain-like protein [Actinospica sp.]|jgi:L-alanine-DL-glutamate epimerase-like enolase superfamily enzyme|uniref:enolase C-terminal domain-like protein n=1 Tax=Actinospica sp. TaxID=1872142 RepID=UPI002CB829A0|nr:enolase C-terminal domain-like protein [Actinospica sp.]HWG23707.1 enolase C-terminal domain-like protein [Actinospica sp.]
MSDHPFIESVHASVYNVPTESPEADGTLAWNATTMIVVRVRAADGTTGLGWTYGAPACAHVVEDTLADIVRGRDPMNVPGAFDEMVKAVRNMGRPGVAGYAISAVDVALWDLKARILGLPLHRLLGSVRESVPVYGSGGFTTYDENELVDQVLHWVEGRRIGRVKIKIGESWGADLRRDLDRIRLVRNRIGADTELYVDANGAYTAKQATRVMLQAAPEDVSWFEEPVSSDDLAGLRAVRESVTADVTAGEYGYDLAYFERMCAAGAVDCLQADVSRCGGITEWQRVAAVAAAHNLEISGHCAPHLHAHVAAATPNLRHLEWFHDHVRIESRFFDGALDPAGGSITPSADAPGHGLAPRESDMEAYR